MLQDYGRYPRAFLDFACKHRALAANVEFVVTMNVFVEQADVKGIADASGKSIDCHEAEQIHGVGDENDGGERRSEYSRERDVLAEVHSLQHRPQECGVLDCMGIGQRRKEREHGGDPPDRRQCHHDRE